MSDFLRIWQYYDADKSGFLERKEVKQFIMDMISTTEVFVKLIFSCET